MPLRGPEEPRDGTIRRSSSAEPLLESAPASHLTPAVAVGEEAVEMAMAAFVEEKEIGATEEEEVVVVENREKAPMAASTGYEAQQRGREAAEQEREKGKKEKKKRRSWLPDPEKRWPVQGW